MQDLNNRFDLALLGEGGMPCLVGLALLKIDPGRDMLVASTSNQRNRDLELVSPDLLAPEIRDVVDGLVVREWPGFHLRRIEGISSVRSPIWLIDVAQGWVELATSLRPKAVVRCSGRVRRTGNVVRWKDGEAEAGSVVELPRHQSRLLKSATIAAKLEKDLDWPVLADFDVSRDDRSFFQYIPLDSGRILVNKFALERTLHDCSPNILMKAISPITGYDAVL